MFAGIKCFLFSCLVKSVTGRRSDKFDSFRVNSPSNVIEAKKGILQECYISHADKQFGKRDQVLFLNPFTKARLTKGLINFLPYISECFSFGTDKKKRSTCHKFPAFLWLLVRLNIIIKEL